MTSPFTAGIDQKVGYGKNRSRLARFAGERGLRKGNGWCRPPYKPLTDEVLVTDNRTIRLLAQKGCMGMLYDLGSDPRDVMHDTVARKAKCSRGVKHSVSQKGIELLEKHFVQSYIN